MCVQTVCLSYAPTLHFHCHYWLEYNPPPPLKFQLSVLANKLRIWSDSSTFSTLPLHTTLCVSTVLSLYTSFMFFVFSWDTVWIIILLDWWHWRTCFQVWFCLWPLCSWYNLSFVLLTFLAPLGFQIPTAVSSVST